MVCIGLGGNHQFHGVCSEMSIFIALLSVHLIKIDYIVNKIIQTQAIFTWNVQTCYYVFHQQTNDSF